MNKRMVLSLGVLILGAASLLAQDSQSKKMISCSGAISADGESFTCDKDHHVWKVSNPAALRDMEGHQAKLTYHRTSTHDEIFVTAAAIIQQQTVAHNTPGPATPH